MYLDISSNGKSPFALTTMDLITAFNTIESTILVIRSISTKNFIDFKFLKGIN